MEIQIADRLALEILQEIAVINYNLEGEEFQALSVLEEVLLASFITDENDDDDDFEENEVEAATVLSLIDFMPDAPLAS